MKPGWPCRQPLLLSALLPSPRRRWLFDMDSCSSCAVCSGVLCFGMRLGLLTQSEPMPEGGWHPQRVGLHCGSLHRLRPLRPTQRCLGRTCEIWIWAERVPDASERYGADLEPAPVLTPVTDSGQQRSHNDNTQAKRAASCARAAAHTTPCDSTALVNVYRLRPTSRTHSVVSLTAQRSSHSPQPHVRHHALARSSARASRPLHPSQPPPSVSARTHAHVPTHRL